MAVAHDADSNANSGATTVASLTWSHTTTGSNTFLLVSLGWTGSSTTMSVTHAGNAPTGSTTSLLTPSLSYHLQMFWWVAPTTGAQNIIATPNASASIFGGGSTFTGVDQVTPTTEQNTSTGTSFGLTSTTLLASRPQVLFSANSMANAATTLTADASATQAFNQFDGTAGRTTAGQYKQVNPGVQDLTWFLSAANARPWVEQIIGINPVGGTAIPHVKNLNSSLRPHPFSPGIAR